jgi:hypothetical protein
MRVQVAARYYLALLRLFARLGKWLGIHAERRRYRADAFLVPVVRHALSFMVNAFFPFN